MSLRRVIRKLSKPLIKICGITRVADGVRALECGAKLLGFIRFPKSPRYRSMEDCVSVLQEIRAATQKPFEAVGVYVDAPVALMHKEQEMAQFERIQLHGSETMQIARMLPVPVIKALKVTGSDILVQADQYPDCDLLTDAPDSVHHGGTGKTYDLGAIEALVRQRRVFVAGGVTAENVGEIVMRLHPYGLDISSGVETAPGIKDHARMTRFFDVFATVVA